MKRILLVSAILLSSLFVLAQQEPLITNYQFNYFLINPAAAGSQGVWSFKANYRNQWVKFPGAPKTAFLSADGAFGRVGAGLNLFHDAIGPEKLYGVRMAYAYHIPVTDNSNFSIGIAGRAMRYTLDPDLISTLDPDPVVMNITEEFLADLALGIYYYSGSFYGGLSVPQLLQIAGGNDGSGNDDARKLERHYYAMLGYKFDISNNFGLEPQAMLSYVDDAPIGYDVRLMGWFIEKQLMFGVGYRADGFLSFLTGFNIKDQYKFGYSYNYSTKVFQEYTWGSHEIMVGYNLSKPTREGASF